MRLELWDKSSKVAFDKRLLAELVSLRFLEAHRHAIVLGPVGVGKTFIAQALGHIACRHGYHVRFTRADEMLRTLKQSRFDNSRDAQMSALTSVDLLILDDFALEPMTKEESKDVYQLFLERTGRGSMIICCNRDTSEWLAMFDDVLLAQSAVDRFKNAAYDFVIDGESYRPRQKPACSMTLRLTAPRGVAMTKTRLHPRARARRTRRSSREIWRCGPLIEPRPRWPHPPAKISNPGLFENPISYRRRRTRFEALSTRLLDTFRGPITLRTGWPHGPANRHQESVASTSISTPFGRAKYGRPQNDSSWILLKGRPEFDRHLRTRSRRWSRVTPFAGEDRMIMHRHVWKRGGCLNDRKHATALTRGRSIKWATLHCARLHALLRLAAGPEHDLKRLPLP